LTARGASTDWYGELTQEGFWAPAVAPSGMTFYAGDKLPRWKGSLFVGTMKNQRLERFSFNEKGFISRPEWLLDDLKQRIRDVRQGPDGLLYLLTDEEAGALIRLEPTPARPTPSWAGPNHRESFCSWWCQDSRLCARSTTPRWQNASRSGSDLNHENM
jgi:hypothetical protein